MTEEERSLMIEISKQVASIETALLGNGTKGLNERVNNTEEWQDKHDDQHRKFTEDQYKYREKREEKELQGEKDKRRRIWAAEGAVVLIVLAEIVSLIFKGAV